MIIMRVRSFSWAARRVAAIISCLILVVAGHPVGAQLASGSAFAQALPSTLGAGARATLLKTLDSAHAAGLPVDPLLDKAAEGALKGADDQRIVAAVQTLARELGEARAMLNREGAAAAPLVITPVLSALAGAFYAGISPAELQMLAHTAVARVASDATTADVFVGALVTLVDLVVKRIPPGTAASSIDQLLGRHSSANQFAELRSAVGQDIRAGRSADAALAARARAQMQATPPIPPGIVLPRRSPQSK